MDTWGTAASGTDTWRCCVVDFCGFVWNADVLLHPEPFEVLIMLTSSFIVLSRIQTSSSLWLFMMRTSWRILSTWRWRSRDRTSAAEWPSSTASWVPPVLSFSFGFYLQVVITSLCVCQSCSPGFLSGVFLSFSPFAVPSYIFAFWLIGTSSLWWMSFSVFLTLNICLLSCDVLSCSVVIMCLVSRLSNLKSLIPAHPSVFHI